MKKALLVTTAILLSCSLYYYIHSINKDDVAKDRKNFKSAVQGNQQLGQAIKIGYFHGGRTALMMRIYEKDGFAKRGLPVEFYARTLRGKEYELVPKSIKEFNEDMHAGKAKGTELIDAMLEGKFDLAMVGESSFIYSIYAGKPIIAIAELGHDVKGQAGHVFLIRKGLKTDGPEDYFGKLFVSRRAGAGDAIFLKEYFEHAGINLKTDILRLGTLPKTLEEKKKLSKNKVIIVEDVYEDEMKRGIIGGVIDGGYFHLMGVPKKMHSFNIVKSLDDWADSELSHALLVCTKEFLYAHRESLITLLETYIERIKYEHGLSYEERTRLQSKGLQMATNLHGLNYPQYDIVPTVGVDLLYKVAGLMRKHKFIGEKDIKIEDFVDNSLVLSALKNLNINEKDNYRQSEY